MALRYLPMISGQQHHHHGNESNNQSTSRLRYIRARNNPKVPSASKPSPHIATQTDTSQEMTWETSSSIPITTAKAHSSLSEVNIRPGTGSHRTIRQRSPRKCLQFESLFCILHTNIKSSGSTIHATLQSNGISNEGYRSSRRSASSG